MGIAVMTSEKWPRAGRVRESVSRRARRRSLKAVFLAVRSLADLLGGQPADRWHILAPGALCRARRSRASPNSQTTVREPGCRGLKPAWCNQGYRRRVPRSRTARLGAGKVKPILAVGSKERASSSCRQPVWRKGRRRGLKILRGATPVWVRFPPPALSRDAPHSPSAHPDRPRSPARAGLPKASRRMCS
jgi:hypothetical protein